MLLNYIPNNDWSNFFNESIQYSCLEKINFYLVNQNKTIFPSIENCFNAFKYCSIENIKIVILGQDPYHNENQANGLCFSVNEGVKLPPTLKNIYKEIENDLNIKMNFNNGNLFPWAEQGILLLNTYLSVEKNKPLSHSKIDWEIFTNNVIKFISSTKNNIIFILWGKFSQQKKSLININKHYVLEASHPSPFSAYKSFFNCKHFSKINNYLISQNKQIIKWKIK